MKIITRAHCARPIEYVVIFKKSTQHTQNHVHDVLDIGQIKQSWTIRTCQCANINNDKEVVFNYKNTYILYLINIIIKMYIIKSVKYMFGEAVVARDIVPRMNTIR